MVEKLHTALQLSVISIIQLRQTEHTDVLLEEWPLSTQFGSSYGLPQLTYTL